MAKYLTLLVLFLIYNFPFDFQKTELTGEYFKEGYYTSYKLSLYNDYSFKYIIKEGLAYDTILGHWSRIKNKQLILSPAKTKAYHLEEECKTCFNTLLIKTYTLKDNNELNMPEVKIYANGKMIKDEITSTINHVLLPKADSIKVHYVGHEPYVLLPKFKNNTIVSIYLKEDKEMLLQKDRVLRIRKNKLITESGITLEKTALVERSE